MTLEFLIPSLVVILLPGTGVIYTLALGISGVVAQLPGALAEFVHERSVCWEAGAKANPSPTLPSACGEREGAKPTAHSELLLLPLPLRRKGGQNRQLAACCSYPLPCVQRTQGRVGEGCLGLYRTNPAAQTANFSRPILALWRMSTGNP